MGLGRPEPQPVSAPAAPPTGLGPSKGPRYSQGAKPRRSTASAGRARATGARPTPRRRECPASAGTRRRRIRTASRRRNTRASEVAGSPWRRSPAGRGPEEGGPGRSSEGGGARGGAGACAERSACPGTCARTSVGTPTARRRPGASRRGPECGSRSATRSGAAPTTCGRRVRPGVGPMVPSCRAAASAG